jgi:DNA polymerase elongation subunit (family B)
LVHQWVSRNLDEFRAPTPAANAMKQLDEQGKSLSPGQSIRFLYIRGKQRARAWDLSETPDPRIIDLPRYSRLLTRAIKTILEPVIGIENIPVVLDKCRQLHLAI